MTFVLAHKTEILGALLALSEVLGAIPAIKANGVFELVVGVLKKIAGK